MIVLAKSVMLGVAGLLVAVLFAAVAPTNRERQMKLPLLAGSTSTGSLPIVYLDRNVEQSQRIRPGVYQTRPYAIVLIVAEPEHDDCSIAGATGAGSKMPVIKPEMRTFPILASK